MKQIEIIAVDTGNRLIKTAHAPAFSAGLNLHGDTPPIMSTDTLIYKGEYFSFSESQGYHRDDKTIDDYYYILTLAAIARELLVKKFGNNDCDEATFRTIMHNAARRKAKLIENIVLSVGLPPRDMKLQAKKFKQYFLQGGNAISFSYNGIEFLINIEEVIVAPQGFAAIIPNDIFTRISQNIQSYIIDIGGYTTDIALVANKKIDTNFFESLDYGVIHMINEIKGKVKMDCQTNISGLMIENILKGQSIANDDEYGVEKTVRNAGQAYANKIVDALRDYNIDLKISVPVLCGGGALLLKDALMRAIDRKNVILLDDVRANAIGYEILAKRMMKERAKLAEE